MRKTIGTVWRIAPCSGIDSGKLVVIRQRFDWHKATDGTYKQPPPHWVAVAFMHEDKIGFIPRNCLVQP